ncbi:helix-turn-helix domain-containing protein, partial [Vibrio metoecus]
RELNGLPEQVELEVTMSQESDIEPLYGDNVTQSGLGYPNDWPLRAVEKAHIQQIVALYDGNKSAAARDLGVARKTLERKYKEWENEDTSHES